MGYVHSREVHIFVVSILQSSTITGYGKLVRKFALKWYTSSMDYLELVSCRCLSQWKKRRIERTYYAMTSPR